MQVRINEPSGQFLYNQQEGSDSVRMKGLEPPRLAAPDPKSGAAANYATSADCPFRKKTSFFTKGSANLGIIRYD
jgi:hypothetical protein